MCAPCNRRQSGAMGGFAALEAGWRRVVVLMTPFPPFGGGEAASWTAVVPKVQTTSVKNAENGQLLARCSAFWAQVCLLWVAARAQTRYCEH